MSNKVKLPENVVKALDCMVGYEMTDFAIICSLQGEKWLQAGGCEESEAIKAHKVLREFSFENSGGNTDLIIKGLANGYEIDKEPTTKHEAFNLTFKPHEVFKGKLVVVDSEDTPFLWLNEATGKVSFGGKYFKLYKEQLLIEALMNFVYSVTEYVEALELKCEPGELQDRLYYKQFKKALEFVDRVETKAVLGLED
ncbi:hypothetical protein [Metabacillus fastidiosus]|uniref:hypothetical protein n=1 Tax=Metabacillus fastidiosus TaxID=1458 RepID=UPI003D2A05A9